MIDGRWRILTFQNNSHLDEHNATIFIAIITIIIIIVFLITTWDEGEVWVDPPTILRLTTATTPIVITTSTCKSSLASLLSNYQHHASCHVIIVVLVVIFLIMKTALTNDMRMRAPRMGINFSGFLDSSSGFVASCFSPDLNYEYSHRDDEDDDDDNYGNDNHYDDFNDDNDDDGALWRLTTRPEYRRWWTWRVKMWRWKDEDDSRVRENWGKLDSMTSVLFAGFFPFYLVVNPSNLTGCENPLCETDLDKKYNFLL